MRVKVFEGFMEFFELFHAAENVATVDGVLLVLNYLWEVKSWVGK